MTMRVLVTGASGSLGAYLLHELAKRGEQVTAWSGTTVGACAGIALRPVPLDNADAVAVAYREARPDIIVHAAALAKVAACYREPARAHAVNVLGTERLTELAGGARLVFVSTDLVFDGEKGGYRETDQPAPLSVYGRSKADAERVVLAHPNAAVVRVSLLYGTSRNGRPGFFDEQVAALRAGRHVTLFEDEWRTPLDLATAARALAGVAASDFTGLLHVGGPEHLSRLQMGLRLAARLRVDPSVIRAVSRIQAAAEPRPRDTSLDSSQWRALFRGQPWPGWDEAVRSLE